MRRNELDQIEAAQQAANPVQRSGDLVDSKEAAAVGLLVRQYTQPDETPAKLEPGPTRLVRPPGRPWMKPVVVFVAACLLALGTIGIVSMMRSDDPGVVDATCRRVGAARRRRVVVSLDGCRRRRRRGSLLCGL